MAIDILFEGPGSLFERLAKLIQQTSKYYLSMSDFIQW